MDARGERCDDGRMPLDLTDAEIATAATAYRAMAYQGIRKASWQSRWRTPGCRGPIENAAKRFAALAAKFEATRKNHVQSP